MITNLKKSHLGNHKSKNINSKVVVPKKKYKLNKNKNYFNYAMCKDDNVVYEEIEKTDKGKGCAPCQSDSSL